ncbi:hypothetical protein ACLB2K_012277 [Fragaria x ananassa]
MLIVNKDTVMIQQLKTDLSEFFDMKDLGLAKRIFGMEISSDRGNKKLWLSQEKYIEKVLERFQMEKAKPVVTPLASHMKLSSKHSPTSQKKEEEMATMPYASAVGSLMYAMMSLCFGNVKSELVGYTYVDMVRDIDMRKSISGYLITFSRGAVSWQSKLQKCVALSTTEAEYIAATKACKEILWLKRFLLELVQEGKAAKYSWWDVNLKFKDTTEMEFGSFDYVPSTPIRVVESHRHERYSSSLSILSDTEFRVEFEFQGKKHEVHGELLNLKREK